MKKAFNCYIISETTLGIQCAELLIKEGHQLLGIISPDNKTQQWANQHKIPYISSIEEFKALTPKPTFDYLFSIVNAHILSKDLLNLPLHSAINYHDAPLPKYAGVNATSWAILNNEVTHGISWHIMNEMTDGGNILKQVTFPINIDETALSLNLKCYTHALEAFKELIKELPQRLFLGKKQNLSNRSYFSLYQKPSHFGFVDWNNSAEDIDRQYRALSFGNYPNTLTTFKVLISNQVYIPTKLEIVFVKSNATPGTIIKIDNNKIQIATQTQDILLSNFKTLEGDTCKIENILTGEKSSIKRKLKAPSKKILNQLNEFSKNISTSETFWKSSFSNIIPTQLSFINLSSASNHLSVSKKKKKKIIIYTEKCVNFSNGLPEEWNHSFTDILIASFLIYLSRLENSSHFTVGFVNSFLNNLPKDLKSFFPRYVPLTCSILSSVKMLNVLKQIKKQIVQIEKNKSYFKDIFIRYHGLNKAAHHLPIIIHRGDLKEIKDIFNEEIFLIFNINENNKTYTLCTNSNLDEISESIFQNCSKHIKNILNQIIKFPEATVDKLSFLTQTEQQNLEEWNNLEVTSPEDKAIHQLFEEQVERTPNNIAVVYEEEQLTYCQLNERANQLAHYLRNQGVEPDTLVAIVVERSVEMIVGLLGILKAGGAYVPLDPDYPQERLHFMLNDTNAPILLTQSHLKDKLKETFSSYMGQIITIDKFKKILQYPTSNPSPITLPHHLAYIIYTSGSTGKPKGVMIGHHNIIRLLKETQQWYKFTSNDVWSLFHSYAFDFSVWEIWGALAYGGKLIIIPYLISRSPEAFYALLKEKKITVLNQTPSAFYQLIEYEKSLYQSNISSSLFIRLVIFGGEALDLYKLKSWFDLHGEDSIQLINMYGITETTVHATYASIPKEHNVWGKRSIIGKKIPDLNIYILDSYMNTVPIGVSGQIYISGPGLARGYLNRPDLTAEKFIPNPFIKEEDLREKKNLRLYCTGDLARYLPDGNIEFLGRIDSQVKIRGFRIELGEIEATLSQHKDIKQALVIVYEGETNHKQLVAYLVCKSPLTQNNKENTFKSTIPSLKSFLSSSLPSYMVPSSFVLLDQFPLTVNGKIDTKTLPKPSDERMLKDSYVAPHNEAQYILTKIWEKVLKIKLIGIHDNFFSLGGDSIRSIQITSLAQKNGFTFSVADIFRHPTIDELVTFTSSSGSNPQKHILKPFSLLSYEDQLKIPENIEDAYPLSALQSGMIFHSQLHSEESIYQDIFRYEIQGQFKSEAFFKTLQILTQRHTILRTSFDFTTYTQPLQIVHKEASIPVYFKNICPLSKIKQNIFFEHWLAQEKKNKVSWNQAPLLRFNIIQTDSNKFHLGMTFHHSIFDGWSVASLVTELLETYSEILEKKLLNKERIKTSFNQYIALEQEAIQSTIQKQFWMSYLKNVPYLTLLQPNNSSKTIERIGTKATYDVPLPYSGEIFAQFAQHYEVPVKTLFLAVHFKVLGVLSGNDEVATGYVTNGRPETLESDKTLGLFLNTIPLRLTFSGRTWEDLIKTTFSCEQEVLPYRFYPLFEMQQQKGHSLFEVSFNYINFHIYENLLQSKQVQVLKYYIYEQTNFTFCASFSTNSLTLEHKFELQYDPTILSQEQIQRIGAYYQEAFRQMIDTPHAEYAYSSLLTASEKEQILIEWNDTKAEYPEDKAIHQLLEEQVEKAPHNVAVIFEDQQLTYQELNQKANQLAHYLRSKGVRPDTLVAIAVERSLEMVIGLLGILKAGGAYVPLDPNYPPERLQFMLEDTKASILLTQAHLKNKFIESTKQDSQAPSLQSAIICLDENWDLVSAQPIINLVSITRPHHLAYVIYTSGSTGVPKGVMITHGNVVAYLIYAKQTYIFRVGTTLFHSSYAFDMSITSIFLPLLTTNSIHILKEEFKVDALGEYIKKEENLNFIKLTPTHLKVLKEELTAQDMHRFQGSMIIGGENLLEEDVRRWIKNTPHITVFNEYGPTETTVGCTVYKIQANQLPLNHSIPIGKPISNTQIYILDGYLNPAPIGVAGELYIGGVGLARGYLNRPDLTAEKFIPNPFVNTEDAEQGKNLRLYRTGDLARYLPDGNIEFLGRIDDQVKIRGFRIELGEIESTLQVHSNVGQAVVIVREDEPGNKSLVAYVVPKDTTGLGIESILTSSANESFSTLKGDSLSILTEGLRNHLGKALPEYMVPPSFVYIDKIPLTSNGKIDRKALPTPDVSLTLVTDAYVAPTTELEAELASIWSEVLKIAQIGIHDNFFKLGGHSLLATQVISRIRHQYKLDVALRSLFEHPIIADLGKVIEELRQKDTAVSLRPPLVPMERKESIPLSFAQQRLWFLDQLIPDVALYNIPTALRLKGTLNRDALEKAFNSLIERHEALRTIFPSEQGEAAQVILPHLSINIEECTEDLRKLKDPQEAIERIVQEESSKPFNISQGPLIRIRLLKVGEEDHILLLTLHHIISDGWSMGVLFKELSEYYNAYAVGKEPNLAPLNVQYADFAIWQRGWLQGEALEQQLVYWKEQLTGIPDILALPTDKPRPKELSYKGSTYHYRLSKDIKDKLNKLAQEEQTSLFMTVLAMFQVLLYRYTGQKDIVVGTPIANRNYKEVEGLIGFFVNTLALRTTFKEGDSFRDVLKRVKETTLQAYQHQDVPFEQLVDHLNVPRALNSNPVFQVMFTFQNKTGFTPLLLESVHVDSVHGSYPIAKFDISFNVIEEGEQLWIGIEYATDLFEESTIGRIAGHFKELSQGIAEDADRAIEVLPLLTTPEKDQILIEWNDTKVAYPEDKVVHQLFEEQVQKTPDNVAIVYEDQQLTYQELNERANQLGHYLRSKGVGPDTLVAIAVERSLEMVVGLLGILKAGGAYVPLDPTYPQDRLEYMLEDTNASILLTQGRLKEQFKGINKHQDNTRSIICLDEDWEAIAKEAKDNLPYITLPHHLAYVIYTSGSTGKPKGVMIEHGNAVGYLKHAQKSYKLSKGNGLFHSSYAFDMSITSIFLPLLTNNSVNILFEGSKIDDLATAIKNQPNLNFIKVTPTHIKALKKHLTKEEIATLRCRLIVGGENLLEEDVRYWINGAPHITVFNEYGPTEATVGCSVYKIQTNQLPLNHSIPVGKPISNTQIYILDSYLNPVPIGVEGEIYIGGTGLARGYLNRPDLTAEKFIPNPFVTQEDVETGQDLRLYRTGDLAQYLPDGNIEFLGRIDDQVKIRGFRIELGEIEATLQMHENVSQAVVIAREDESGNKRLVAYVVPREFTPSITELREFLEDKLPEYMVPSFFLYIDKIPLTPNGKVDRKVLPAPDASSRLITDTYVAPTTELEAELASIWSEVLKVDKIGIHDNFFRIGGDSIISIQLVAKARQKGIHFAVKDVFKYPTISALVLIAQKEAMHPTADQTPTTGEVLFTPIQHWFFNSALSERPHYNQAMLLEPFQPLDINTLNKTFNTIINHHDALRFRYYQDNNQQWHQEAIEREEHVLCSQVGLSHIHKDNLPIEIERESNLIQASLDLQNGLLIKVVLFECGNQGQRLLIVIHHLVVDGVSWRILLEDLENVYKQVARGGIPSLPAKTHSYQKWAKALQEYASSKNLQEEIPYWQQIEDHIQPLPTDFNLGPAIGSTIKTIEVVLTEEETTNLLQRAPQAYRTEINDILLTALVLAIGDWINKHELTLSLEGHGREDIIKDMDLARTVGWFTSIFPVHLKIHDSTNIGEVIKTVKETLRHIPHKGIGYGILKYLSQEPSLNHNIHPTISFNYLGQWDNTFKQDSLFSYAKESVGNSLSEKNTRSYLLDINGKIIEDRLQMFWSYSTNHYEKSTIEQISHRFTQRLQQIIRHCCQEGVSEYTPSDFKLVNYNQIMIINDLLNRNKNE